MLYSRDYTKGLTEDEQREYKRITGRIFTGKRVNGSGSINMPSKYPKAARMCLTLFPNNYLDNVDLKNIKKLKNLNEQFLDLLNNKDITERNILNYIKETKSYHIIGSVLRGCQLLTGNHGVFLFPEFQLGSTYIADYLLCAKSSGGYEFILIELESPLGNITLKNGDLGYEFRDGISQLKEWKRFIQANYSSFNEVLRKYKNPNMDMPQEFYSLDLSRFHFVVVAGRRYNFTELTYTLKREFRQTENIYILHYDNLYDFSNMILGNATY